MGQLSYYRLSATGQLDEIQSVGLTMGGIGLAQSSKHSSFLISAHSDPVRRLWSLNSMEQPIKRYTFHNMSAEGIDVSPFDGEEFVSCSKDSSFAIWTMSESEPIFAATNDAAFPVLAGVRKYS